MNHLSALSANAAAFSLALLMPGSIDAQSGCHAAFTFTASADSLTIDFEDSSTSGHTIISWSWDFGDGNTSTSQNPSHTYAQDGTFYVCLTIHDDHGCSATTCHHVTVHHAAAACHAAFSFQASSDSLTIDFDDSSTSDQTITSWFWDFGDGNASTAQNPSHAYAHDGTYTVCLTIHDDHGCTATTCHQVTVHPVHLAHPHHDAHLHHDGHHHHDAHHDDHASGHHPEQGRALPKAVFTTPELMIAPNPFSVSTTLEYVLPRAEHVLIEIHDVAGKSVLQLVNENRPEGRQLEQLNAGALQPGSYLIRLSTGDGSSMEKIMLIGK